MALRCPRPMQSRSVENAADDSPGHAHLGIRYLEMVSRSRMALGAVLIAVGSVWTAQGLDLAFAPASFMTGQTEWIYCGLAAVLGGIFTLAWRRRPPDG